MVTLTVEIVGHVERERQALALAEQLGGHVSIDDGTLGVYGNHRRALNHALWHASASHVLVLEDDALPVSTLIGDATALATERPDHLIGLYVGQLYPPSLQPAIQKAAALADQQWAHWLGLDTTTLRWAVGYVVPVADVPNMLAHADGLDVPADRRLGAWHGARGRVSYSWPSLVDHADGPRLHNESGARRAGRVAWRAGSLDRDECAID